MKTIDKLIRPNSGVCIGLDPDPKKYPDEFNQYSYDKSTKIFLKEIINITKEFTTAYKIQKAFFDLHKDGDNLIKKITKNIRKENPNATVFMDSKIGDIGNTMKAYLKKHFEDYDCDGTTVNPYMGGDVFKEFKNYPDKSILLLSRTSNESAYSIQDKVVEGKRLWEHVLEETIEKWDNYGNIIPILSHHINNTKIREKIGDRPILYAGIGAQGGDINKAKKLLNSYNSGIIVNSSRGILYPYEKNNINWRNNVIEETEKLYNMIESIKNE
ncbi:MAG: orotidine-5'-phosphate decarboxylase [Nanobdellota archaeon]